MNDDGAAESLARDAAGELAAAEVELARVRASASASAEALARTAIVVAGAIGAVMRGVIPTLGAVAGAFAAAARTAGEAREDERRRLLREYRRRPDSPAAHAKYVAWCAGEGGEVGDGAGGVTLAAGRAAR